MTATRMTLVVILGGGLFLMGCASDFDHVGQGARPGRAVQSPVETNSTTGEIAAATNMEGVPLVTVGFPNKSGEAPVVRTIVDDIAHPPMEPQPPVRPGEQTIHSSGITVTGSATQPATRPATTQPAGARIDPLLGPGE